MARILVVDDDADILRLVDKVLRLSGHEVFTAHDAMKAMDLLNTTTYDILITDANMPRFSGFELVRTMRNNRRFQRMGVCMLTGLREKKDIEKAIRAGVEDYIVKPIDPALLMQKIAKMLEKKPPLEILAIDIPETASYAKAQVAMDARITHVSETGLVFISSLPLTDGLNINMASELFKKMDIKTPPKMKITSCRRLLEFEYEVHVTFVALNDGIIEKLYAWIELQHRTALNRTKKREIA